MLRRPSAFALAAALALTCLAMPTFAASLEHRLAPTGADASEAGRLTLFMTEQPPASGDRSRPVLYVHGATFSAALSVFYRFDGRSWADALNEAGFTVFGLDFAGYGLSDRYPVMANEAPTPGEPLGRSGGAEAQIARAVERVRAETGATKVAIVAHSWGTIPAARFAIAHADRVESLVLFGAILPRDGEGTPPAIGAWRFLTAEEQRRRFVEDVPAGEPAVLDPAHFAAWAAAWLATDRHARERDPAAVRTPNGPVVDIFATWNRRPAYDASQLAVPVLNVRGAWDSLSTDADARRFMAALTAAPSKEDIVIPRATHLMHLEAGRHALHEAVNRFLMRTNP